MWLEDVYILMNAWSQTEHHGFRCGCFYGILSYHSLHGECSMASQIFDLSSTASWTSELIFLSFVFYSWGHVAVLGRLFTRRCDTWANSAFNPSGVSKRGPASSGKAKSVLGRRDSFRVDDMIYSFKTAWSLSLDNVCRTWALTWRRCLCNMTQLCCTFTLCGRRV